MPWPRSERGALRTAPDPRASLRPRSSTGRGSPRRSAGEGGDARDVLTQDQGVDVVVIDCSCVRVNDEAVSGMMLRTRELGIPVIAMVHPTKAYAADGPPGEWNTLAEEINYALLLHDLRVLSILQDSPTEQLTV